VFFYGEQTPFPGLAALLPCLGTIALIWANAPSRHDSRPTWVAFVLSWKPVVFVGLISYSLYLWHWPVLCFVKYWKFGQFHLIEKLLLVSVAILLAIISWIAIERPFRRKKQTVDGSYLLFGSCLLMSLICTFGLVLFSGKGFPQRLPQEVRALLDLDSMNSKKTENIGLQSETAEHSVWNIKTNTLLQLGQKSKKSIDFLLWGDSHARRAQIALEHLSKNIQVSGAAAYFYSTPPLIGSGYKSKLGKESPDEVASAIINYVRENSIKNVFMIAYWSLYAKDMPIDRFHKSLRQTIRDLNYAGAKVWLFLDVPTHKASVPKMLSRFYILPFLNRTIKSRSIEEHREINQSIYKFSPIGLNVETIDVSKFLIDDDGKYFLFSKDGVALYDDDNHLNVQGSLKVYVPALNETNIFIE